MNTLRELATSSDAKTAAMKGKNNRKNLFSVANSGKPGSRRASLAQKHYRDQAKSGISVTGRIQSVCSSNSNRSRSKKPDALAKFSDDTRHGKTKSRSDILKQLGYSQKVLNGLSRTVLKVNPVIRGESVGSNPGMVDKKQVQSISPGNQSDRASGLSK